jgi:3-hydroxyethyl bacteriochlorophyllide a dehydrogenase
MQTQAIVLEAPRALTVAALALTGRRPGQVTVAVHHSGVSTGTERLLWEGRMPAFPGMGYPLVPGYEAVGEIVHGTDALPEGTRVFVPGASCYEGARGLFGASAALLHADAERVVPTRVPGPEATLLALAATARHALTGPGALPGLVIGHGTLGRLAARLIVAAGGEPIVVERDPARRIGAEGYAVVAPEEATGPHERILDASGDPAVVDAVMPHLARGGEVVLAGFYAEPVSFAFPPAFLREARLRVSAEFAPADLLAVRDLVEEGAVSLSGLVTHRAPASDGAAAYAAAFGDPACLKMVLDWSDA